MGLQCLLLFRHSHGGTGWGSAHKPFLASRAAFSSPSSPDYSVRREKVHVPSGCESRPATVAPAGSNRSVEGGNELDEASGVEGRHWRLGEQAGRNVSER